MEAGYPGGGDHVQVVGPCLLLVQVWDEVVWNEDSYCTSPGMISRLFLSELAALLLGLMTAAWMERAWLWGLETRTGSLNNVSSGISFLK